MTRDELQELAAALNRAINSFHKVQRSDLVEGPVRADGDQNPKVSFQPFYSGFVWVRHAAALVEKALGEAYEQK